MEPWNGGTPLALGSAPLGASCWGGPAWLVRTKPGWGRGGLRVRWGGRHRDPTDWAGRHAEALRPRPVLVLGGPQERPPGAGPSPQSSPKGLGEPCRGREGEAPPAGPWLTAGADYPWSWGRGGLWVHLRNTIHLPTLLPCHQGHLPTEGRPQASLAQGEGTWGSLRSGTHRLPAAEHTASSSLKLPHPLTQNLTLA